MRETEDEMANTATAGDAGKTTAGQIAHDFWGWMLARGLLAIALGVVAIMWPLSAVFAFTLIFAAYAFADGVISLISGIRGATHHQRWGALIFRGIVGIAVGVIFILLPGLATATYAYLTGALLAAWSIVAGLFEIGAAVRLRKLIEGEWLLAFSGAISLLLGIAIFVLIFPNPVATILSAAWLIAIYALVAGIVLVFQAFRLKRLRDKLSG
jgi:uncharacterized membrane protein HdeD (DUF308 family)